MEEFDDIYIPDELMDDYPPSSYCFLSKEVEIDREETLEAIREKEFFDALDEEVNLILKSE